MLFLGSKIQTLDLFSVRSGGIIGNIVSPIINPHNLHIDGFYAKANNDNDIGIILDKDIRDFSPKGVIINDHLDISEPEDLVRLKPILDLNYDLFSKLVYENKNKVGKVIDFSIDSASLYVQKLYVNPTLLKSINSGRLIFDRQSIIEVTDTKIVVSGPEDKASISELKRFQPTSLRSASTSTISE